ncbi:MAG: AAA family ATPase [Magnetococcus sp. MYC-9]
MGDCMRHGLSLILFCLPLLAIAEEELPTVAESPVVQRRDVAAAGVQQTLEQPDFPVLATAVSPDGRRLATAGQRIVHLWERNSGRLLHTWRAGNAWIRSVAFSPDGQLLAVGGDEGVVRLWEWGKGQERATLHGSGGAFYSVVFSPSGTLLAAGTADHKILLWDVGSGQLLKQWSGHQAPVRGLAFSPDGVTLLSGAQDGTVNRWNMAQSVPVARPFKGTREGIYAVAYSPDGKWIAAGGFRSVHLWNALTGHAKPPLKQHASWVRSLSFSGDSSRLAAVGDDGHLHVWQIADGATLESWAGHLAPAFAVSHIQDQEWISAGGDGRILIWQQGVTTPTWSLIGHPDGRWISCRMLGERACWQAGDGENTEPTTPTAEPDPVLEPYPNGLTWSEMGSMVVALLLLLTAFGKRSLPVLRGRVEALVPAIYRRCQELGVWRPPSPARFARWLGAEVDRASPGGRHLARLHLPADFPLSIREFIYIRVQPGQDLTKIPSLLGSSVRHPIQDVDSGGEPSKPLVILVGVMNQQTEALHRLAHQQDWPWVVVDRGDLTGLLLAAHPAQSLATLLANRVEPAMLSPYQTGIPVEKSSLFFGRQPLLERFVQERSRNHLLIGGAGMGKSSLLRALARKYERHPLIRAHLFSPVQGDITTPLAHSLGYASGSLETLLDELERFPDRKKPVLLVDDADSFVASDADNRFAILERLCRFSEQGCCHTILAGSWTTWRMLHGTLSSRLSQLLEIHVLGPMEREAAWSMAHGPMAWLQRAWEPGVCMALLQGSGGRPDWIMSLCHAVLKQLALQERRIARHHLDAALISQEVGEMFDRWSQLVSDGEEERRQDRLVVYGSVSMESFTHAELLAFLRKRQAAFSSSRSPKSGDGMTAESLQQAMDRLELACILLKIGDRYCFSSDMLRTRILQQHPEDRLKRVLRRE